MKIKYFVVLLLVFIGSFFLSYFLKNSEIVQKLFNSNTTIKFNKPTFDFGDIPAEKEVVTCFVYKNIGEHALKIKNIQSSCGCTIPKWSREKLRQGKKDSIMVMYDAETYGYFSKAIYIFSNAESSPDALYIEGNVVEKK